MLVMLVPACSGIERRDRNPYAVQCSRVENTWISQYRSPIEICCYAVTRGLRQHLCSRGTDMCANSLSRQSSAITFEDESLRFRRR